MCGRPKETEILTVGTAERDSSLPREKETSNKMQDTEPSTYSWAQLLGGVCNSFILFLQFLNW